VKKKMGEMADYSLPSQMWPEDSYWPSQKKLVSIRAHTTKKGGNIKMAVNRPGKGKLAKAGSKTSEQETPLKGGMTIHIPEGLGGDLKVMVGSTKASLEKLAWGLSQAKQPKVTFMYTVLDELNDDSDQPTTVGERVLETYSLQPQALFKLNDAYKAVTGEGLPAGDYSEEEFHTLVEETFEDTEWRLVLKKGFDDKGKERTEIEAKTFLGK
jgi:hypothetical protein